MNSHRTPCRHRATLGAAHTAAAAFILLAGGCQSYEPAPLDLAGHRAAILERAPDSLEVAAFAASIARAPSGAAPAFDATDGISAAEAEIIALVFNPDLRVARLRAGVTRASAENAGLWQDPEIGVDLARIIQSTPEPWKIFASIGFTLPISGRLEVEKRRAGSEHAAELLRVAQEEWRVRMAVRRAWTEWSSLNSRLLATREFIVRVDQVLTVVDLMEAAGEMSRTEARLFRMEKIGRGSDQALLEARVAEGALLLRRLMGLSPESPVRFDGSSPGPAVSGSRPAPERAEVERRSPAVLIAAAEYEASERTLELEVRRQYPDLRIGPGYGREDGQDQVLLGLSLPIPIVNGNRLGIAEARARRELARAGAEATLEGVLAALHAAESRARAAAEQRRVLETELVPLVDAQYADARELVRLGEVNALVLLESLSRQQDAKVRLIEASRDEAFATIDIAELLGPEPQATPTDEPAEDN